MNLITAVAGANRAADADRQQDGMRTARFRAGAGAELRLGARATPRGVPHARLHVQLGAQEHVHRHTVQGRLQALHKGRF